MQRFADRVAVITGGAGGIGRATAQRLAAEGATVFVECGPGRVLTALTKRIADGATALSVEDPAGLEKTLAAVKA